MLKYCIKRLLLLIPILIAVSFIVFALMTMTGDPVRQLMGEEATEEDIEAKREELGYNDPVVIRYGNYMWNLLHGDLGTTIKGRDVWVEFITRFPNTVRLAIFSICITVILALPMGIIAAVKQNTLIDTALSTIAMAGISMPSFWLGLLLVLWLSVGLGLLPATGADTFKHLIMPGICLGVNNASLVTRMTRSSMVDVIRADYLRTARAKGCSEKTVILKHALKNALIPIITIVGSQFSILMGGTVVLESIFAFNGTGNFTVSCIRNFEQIAATTSIIMTCIFTAIVLLAVDIVYAFVDPRVKARYTKK
jgi:peptide/nickel transport system permease protein